MAFLRTEMAPLRGVAASPGIGVGAVRRLAAPVSAGTVVAEDRRAAELERALDALAAAASQLDALAARLRTDGRDSDAEIVETGALMALDPGLAADVGAAVANGRPAPDAILAACAAQADVLAALADEMLAARADDVRSLGRRAALLAAGSVPAIADGRDFVLVAEDLGPAEIAELDAGVQAVALAGGGATTHAAIVARSLGIPLVAELGDAVLALADGAVIVVDGSDGVVVTEPDAERIQHARAAAARRTRAREHAAEQRAVPADDAGRAADHGARQRRRRGRAATRARRRGRRRRAPAHRARVPAGRRVADRAQHRRALEPVLGGLGGAARDGPRPGLRRRQAPTVPRRARRARDRLLLQAPDALAAQLRAILEAAAGAELRVLLPLVGSTAELEAAAAGLRAAAKAVGAPVPPLGPMIETPGAAAHRRRARRSARASSASAPTTSRPRRSAPTASAPAPAPPTTRACSRRSPRRSRAARARRDPDRGLRRGRLGPDRAAAADRPGRRGAQRRRLAGRDRARVGARDRSRRGAGARDARARMHDRGTGRGARGAGGRAAGRRRARRPGVAGPARRPAPLASARDVLAEHLELGRMQDRALVRRGRRSRWRSAGRCPARPGSPGRRCTGSPARPAARGWPPCRDVERPQRQVRRQRPRRDRRERVRRARVDRLQRSAACSCAVPAVAGLDRNRRSAVNRPCPAVAGSSTRSPATERTGVRAAPSEIVTDGFATLTSVGAGDVPRRRLGVVDQARRGSCRRRSPIAPWLLEAQFGVSANVCVTSPGRPSPSA